jgi:fibronectin-binding autotransporter adhesin
MKNASGPNQSTPLLKSALLGVAAACLMAGGLTQAQTVNFDTPGGVGAVNYSGPGAAADPGVYWNAIAFQGTTSGALQSDGATASAITLTDTSPGNFNPGQGTQGTPGGLEAPYAYASGGATATETLNNVPAGTYNLYLYGKNYPYSDRGTTFAVSVGGTSVGTLSTVCSTTSSFTQGNDYVEFTNVTVTAGEAITFTYTGNTGVSGNTEGDFNGLQLVNAASSSAAGPSPGPGVLAVWTGAVNANWNIGATANWLTNGVAGVYSQSNVVQFDDTSSVNDINLAAALTPTSVLVDDNSANYIFAGPGSLGGDTNFTLTKEGGATLLINNANTFAGNVLIGGGTLQIGNGAALGTTTGSTIVSNGATLDFNGFNIGSEPVFVQGAGSSGQGALFNSGADVYPAVSEVTLTGDTTFGANGRWDIRPQGSGSTFLSTGGHGYNLTKVGSGFVGLVGVMIDPALMNIDVQGGTLDFEGASAGSLGDTNGTLTYENSTTMFLYQLNGPISKPIAFNDGSLLNNYSGTATFSGPVSFNGYIMFGLAGSVNITGPLSGGGSPLEIATGSGNTLSIDGVNNYTGDIYLDTSSAGLALNGNGAGATGTVYVGENDAVAVNGSFGGSITDGGAGGTILSGSGTIAGTVDFTGEVYPGGVYAAGTLTAGALTLESGAVVSMDLSPATSGTNDLLQVDGNLTLNGNRVVINALQGNLQIGKYTLIKYTGMLTGTLGAVESRSAAAIDYSTPGQINLNVTGTSVPASLVWSATNNAGNWDTGVSPDWINLGTGAADLFYSGDQVTFNDAAGAPTTVSIASPVSPSSITVNSSTNNYTFSGTGSITGSGGLVKQGSSTLTLSVSGSFTGPVQISGGTVETASSTLASVSSITVTNGGTLDFGGTSFTGNKQINISGQGAAGKGALFNSVGSYPSEVVNIALTGDATFAGSQRWDLGAGSQISGAHNLTIDWSAGAGYGEWNTLTIGANVLAITLTNASNIGMKFMDTAFQNPATVFNVSSNDQMTFYNGGFNGSIHLYTNAQIYHYTAPAGFAGSTLVMEGGSALISYYATGATTPVNSAVTLNGIAHFVIGDHNMVYTNLISGPGGFVEDYYNNQMVFSSSNTYTGPTIIGSSGNSPEVALTGNGSISHSSLIFFGGNDPTVAHMDVTGRADQTLTLASGQTLAGVGGINGSLVVSDGATLSPAGTNTTIGITTGTNATGEIGVADNVTLEGTTVIKLNGSGTNDGVGALGNIIYGGELNLVNISSSALASGNSFKIFTAANYSGSFASIVPTTPGAGLTWDLSQLNSGIIGVSGGSSRPVVGTTKISGSNLVLTGSGGTPNGTFYVLTTTNLATPLANWLVISTNIYDASGNFSVSNSISAGAMQRFYSIKQ